MSRGPRHTFECRPYCFYDSGSFVRRRGVTCAQRSRRLRGSRSDRGLRACAKTCLGDVAMVKKWRPWTSCMACSSKNTVGCQKLLRRSCKVCLCGLQVGRESPLLCIGNTCELDGIPITPRQLFSRTKTPRRKVRDPTPTLLKCPRCEKSKIRKVVDTKFPGYDHHAIRNVRDAKPPRYNK